MERGEYDASEDIRRALFRRLDDLMFAHTAYFDDSVKKETEQLLVGGYIATVREWEAFSADWRISLARKGIKQFKRANFNAHDIGDWPEPERDHFLAELAGLIHQYTKHAFGYAISMPDWRRVNEKYQLVEKNYYPYPICARTCIKGVREWCDENGYDKAQINYAFDAGSEHADHLIELLKRDIDPVLRTVVPRSVDSAEVRPVQAADYLAWEIRHQTLKDINPLPTEAYPTLARLLRIPERSRARAGIYDFARLEDLAIKASVPLR